MIEQLLREEKAKNVELVHIVNEQKRAIENFDKEKQSLTDSFQEELRELQYQMKVKTDRARTLEVQARETAEELVRIKDRVRVDIRKIRIREKELENRLEIMKKDSEALIGARETKIIELKRKVDLLEFNMDLLQDQYAREKESISKLRDRLEKAAQVVRVMGGLLDSDEAEEERKPGFSESVNQNEKKAS
jgi:hypothetical protein